MAEKAMREASVAELRVERSASDAAWVVTSRNRLVDQAVADALPSKRRGGSADSNGFVRTVLVDEIAIRIDEPGSVLNGLAPLKGKGDQCTCHEDASQIGKFGCFCGCHSGGLCRAAILRTVGGTGPGGALLFRIPSIPTVGPIFMRSTSWSFCLSLLDLAQIGGWEDGPMELKVALRRRVTRTRSGIEVALAQPMVRWSRSETLGSSYQLAV